MSAPLTITVWPYPASPADRAELTRIEADLRAVVRRSEHAASLLLGAISGIMAEYNRRIISAAQSECLIAGLRAAEVVAVDALLEVGSRIQARGFRGVRGLVALWAVDLDGRQRQPARFRSTLWRDARRFRNELQRVIALGAAAPKTWAVEPEPASTSVLDTLFSIAAARFESVACGVDPIANAAVGLRSIIAALENAACNPAVPSASETIYNRLAAALRASVWPLADAVDMRVASDDVAVTLGCATNLVKSLSSAVAIPAEPAAWRVCAGAHVRLLAAELDVIFQRRLIEANSNMARRVALGAHLMNCADRVSAAVH